ncbi:MAG: bifunctional metallophosphatase/5'-nucleotidase [Bacteroidales bacterium]|nr:bifunctional metallophosphatase/5'-nucleotidase [Candidatus Cryptobacteroides aphodequi]
MLSKRFPILLPFVFVLAACSAGSPSDGTHTLHILSTGDVHGAWFPRNYTDLAPRTSLMGVKCYADSLRALNGEDNVLLLDAGDCLQGDNAAFYSNYENTQGRHLYARLADYVGYDAVIVGNHDVETGPAVYGRVGKDLGRYGIPFLAANAVKPGGKSYFQDYAVYRKAGLKVLVMGFTNANIKAWLPEEKWAGMDFRSLEGFAQRRLNGAIEKEKPDAVVVVAHSGTGRGDGGELENQGMDLLNSLHGVDVIICAHDHRPYVENRDSVCLLDAGSKASRLGHATLSAVYSGGVRTEHHSNAEIIRIDAAKADAAMDAAFAADFEAVRAWTLRPIGLVSETIRTRDAIAGQCFYTDFIHKVQLDATGAKISFAAPLTYNGIIERGEMKFSDLFTLYPFENTLVTMRLYGREIVDYLEYSYDNWLIKFDGSHVLRMECNQDSGRWRLLSPTYNFDSAGGLNYTVDINGHYGTRIEVLSLADGSAFEADSLYTVAMTSYRASGGGDLILKGCHLMREELPERMDGSFPEIRDLMGEFITRHPVLEPEHCAGVGTWKFIPDAQAGDAIKADMDLIFRKR